MAESIMLDQVVQLVRCVPTDAASLLCSSGPCIVSQLIHEMPSNVVAIVSFGELDTTDRTFGANADLFHL